ncbi:MAG: 5-aminolevulinate synthase [Sphingobacteriales bacterium]|jgi:5-aminolevulinate synthase|nr:MAG: 5-aminolevulinate synthase [Sphingobacteriales bacterium]
MSIQQSFNYSHFLTQKLEQLKTEGNYRYFLEVNKSARHFPAFYFTDTNGKQQHAVNWCSNDYLGMSTHEEVISKMGFVAHNSGTGSGGTRNISGTTNYHKILEAVLAKWHKKETALLFNGAYQANVTTLQTLGKNIPGLVILSDEKNHASIIEGIRGCKNDKKIFRHNDLQHLEELLAAIEGNKPKLIVFESVYSMSGTIAPVKEIVALAKKYNALTYIDEVHGVGLYGNTGAGILEQENLQSDIDIVNGTLSKAIGVFGGYIAASNTLIDFVRSFGSGFIFTTSLPPAVCAAATKSIQLIQEETIIRTSFFNNVLQLRQQFSNNNIPFIPNNSHITILPVKGADECRKLANVLLLAHGIYLQPINFPTVPSGEECLRIIITAKHLPKHINHLAYSLKKIIHGNNPTNRQELEAVVAAD